MTELEGAISMTEGIPEGAIVLNNFLTRVGVGEDDNGN